MNQHFSIAIDGPSGAGKSSVAKQLAASLHAVHLDTGAMYRAVGLYMLEHQIPLRDEALIAQAAELATVDVFYRDGQQRVSLCGEDVTDRLRTQALSAAASAVSSVGAVRERLVARQKDFAARQNVVMDGRDIGEKVLPDATLKIYLTASLEARAQRRYLEDQARGIVESYEQVLSAMQARDLQDSTRKVSPLTRASDAIEVDTTNMTQEEAVETILRNLETKLCKLRQNEEE